MTQFDAKRDDSSEKPDYQRLWCWKCQKHSDYHTQSAPVQNPESGRLVYERREFSCLDCNKKMHSPQAYDPVILKRPAERGCLWIYWTLVVMGLCILGLLSASSLTMFLGILTPAVFIVIFIPWFLLRWSANKYAIWRAWAIERGWKEPSLQKRIRMAKNIRYPNSR